MIHGSITALVTPFQDQDGVDHAALEKLVEFQLENGSDGLVVAGTTGESACLRGGEFESLVRAVVEQVAGRVPVLAGTGSASTAGTVENTRLAARLGADAALVVTPYYNRPTQNGMAAHFRAVADAAELPVVLYNVPGRTGVDLLPDTVAQLCDHHAIIGIKEAVGEMNRVEGLRRACPADFILLSGDDETCTEAMLRGAQGVISVVSNIAPGPMHALCEAARAGDEARARQLAGALSELMIFMGVEANPIPVKWCLFEMGLIGPHIRLPMTPLDEAYRERARQLAAGLDNLLKGHEA